jgi:hypothetical protein
MFKRHFMGALLVLGLTAWVSNRASAQVVATPRVGGMVASCVDALGATVYTFFSPGLNDVAAATVSNGTRFIIINPSGMAALPPLLQVFVYAHECAHHLNGDVLAEAYLKEVNFEREKDADKVAIRILRDRLNVSLSQATSIANFFSGNPPIFPFYLPGPERASWILACYNTNTSDCTTGQFQTPGSPSVAANRCERQYQACIAAIPPRSACMTRRPAECVRTCQDDYGYSYNLCVTQMCRADAPMNINKWDHSCADREVSERQDCRDERDSCG